MVIVRSPLRISLGGGGTDLPSYYQEYGGFLIAAAIDKYIYINITKPFKNGIFLKYSKLEECSDVESISHPIFREAIKAYFPDDPNIEITSLADIPSGTGLGSSGSFTTGLIKALNAYQNKIINQEDLAKDACYIEIEKLGEPIGKQDQYISAIGGITSFAFHQDDSTQYAPLNISTETLIRLEDNLLLFFTGYSRNASDILSDQKSKMKSNDKDMVQNLHNIKQIGYESKKLLENGSLESYGKLMHEHWLIKKSRSTGMSNNKINEWYEYALKNGALGGKLVGAGGGGFLLFVAENPEKLRGAMRDLGLNEVRFRFDFEGTKLIS